MSLSTRLGVPALHLSTARRLGISDAILARWVALASLRPKTSKAPKAIGPPRGKPRVRFPIDIWEIRADGERVKDLAHRISVHPEDISVAIAYGLRPSTWDEWKGRAAVSPYAPPPPLPPPQPHAATSPRLSPWKPARVRACRESAWSDVVNPHDPGIPVRYLPSCVTNQLGELPGQQDFQRAHLPTPPWHGSLRSHLHRGPRASWHAWPSH